MNLLSLSALVHDKQSSVVFLQQHGILHNPRMCSNAVLPKVVVRGPAPIREPAAAGPQSESRNWTENQKMGLNVVIRNWM